jgi:hypothetical protein
MSTLYITLIVILCYAEIVVFHLFVAHILHFMQNFNIISFLYFALSIFTFPYTLGRTAEMYYVNIATLKSLICINKDGQKFGWDSLEDYQEFCNLMVTNNEPQTQSDEEFFELCEKYRSEGYLNAQELRGVLLYSMVTLNDNGED